MDIQKALNLAGAEYLIPEVIDGEIRDYVSKEPVLYNVVSKMPWATNTYFIRKRTALPTATWGTDGGALPGATNVTYGKVSKTIKYLYTRGEVTGPAQRAAGSLFNVLAMEIEQHSRVMVTNLSTEIATGAGASYDIEGIVTQTDSAYDLNVGSGYMNKESDYLTLALLDEAIDNTLGEGDIILTSRVVRRKINSLLQAQQQFVNEREISAGFRVITYDGLPIVTDMHWETNTDLVIFRRSDARLLVHQDFTYEELAKTKDSTDFMIKWYGGFALEGHPVHLKFKDVSTY